MSALEELVRPSLARIVAPRDGYAPDRDAYWGSGFFVAPGWLLTCAHVVGKGGADVWRSEGAVGVDWQGAVHPGTVVLARPRPHAADTGRTRWEFPDIALVRVPGAQDAPCVWLSDRPPVIPADVSLHGWSRQTGDLGMRHGIGGATTLDGKALVLTGSLPVEGVSGGPVADLRRRAVIAMNKGRGRDEGAAVPITALHDLFAERGGEILHTVVREHDLHHLRRFTGGCGPADWIRAQAELPGAATGLTPALRAHLYGHFAHLPPPDRPGEVMGLVDLVKSRVVQEGYHSLLGHAPHTWREGAGLLHGLRGPDDGVSSVRRELDAVLLYAAHVVRHTERLRPAGTDPRRLHAFTDWIREQATDGTAHPVIRREIEQLLARRPPTAAGPAPAAARTGGDVLVYVEQPVYGGLYPWSVKLLHDGRDVTPVDGDDTGVRRGELPASLRQALAEALSRGDDGEHLAAVEVFLPRDLLDLDIDEWRLSPRGAGGLRGADADDDADDDLDDDFLDEHSLPLGLRRTVVVRDLMRHRQAPAPEWRRRWKGVSRGPLSAVPLRGEATADGHPPEARPESTHGVFRRLSTAADECVPVYCGPVGSGRGAKALRAALVAGHPVVLWRRDAHDHDECRAFQQQAARLLGLANGAADLHRHIRELRIRIADPDPGTARADGPAGRIAVLHDPPDRPAHGTEAMRPPLPAGPGT